MFNSNIKLFLLTSIFSTLLSLNTFAMNADEDVRRAASGLAPINSNWNTDQRRDYEQLRINEQRRVAQAARNEEEKEKERQEWWEKEGKAEAEKREAKAWAAWDESIKEREKKRKEQVEIGPGRMRLYNEEVSKLSAEDRSLWEEWDEERNWRKFYEMWGSGNTFHKEKRTRAYLPDFYYNGGGGGCEKKDIAEAGLADRRLDDILYFEKHKTEITDKVREYKEYRLRIYGIYKEDKKLRRKFRQLFPENEKQRCKIS